jgi:hypothetical protein
LTRFATRLASIGVRVSPRPEKKPETAFVSAQKPPPTMRMPK